MRPSRRLSILPSLLVLGAGSAVAQDAPLTVGTTLAVERALPAGGVQLYRIIAAPGQRLFVQAKQHGIDVSLTLLGLGGAKLAEVDEQKAATDVELLESTILTPGEHTLEVRSTQPGEPAGRCEVVADLVAPAEEQRSAALTDYFAAERFRRRPTPDARKPGLDRFTAALAGWRSLQDRRGEARALYGSAVMSFLMETHTQTSERLELLLPLYLSLGDRRGEANALYLRGRTLENLNDKSRAAAAYAAAIPLYAGVGDAFREAMALLSLAGIDTDTARYEDALERTERALLVFRERGDRFYQELALNTLGVVSERMGRHQQALDYYGLAMPLAREMKDQHGVALLLNNIATIHRILGDLERALPLFLESRELLKDHSLDMGMARSDAIVLSNIGWIHENQGSLEKALEYHEQAVAISRSVGDQASEAITVQKIGFVREKQGDYRGALASYEKARDLFAAVEDHQRVADSVRCVADAHRLLGELPRALELYGQALERHRAMGDRKAEAAALLGRARAGLESQALDEALADSEAALAVVEQLRADVVSEELRAAFLGSIKEYYDVHLDVLMRLHERRPERGFAAAALQASERARARVLLETLAASRGVIREGIEPALLDREREISRRVNEKANRLARFGERSDPAEAAAARRELEDALDEHRALQDQIRQRSPRYAALTQPAPLDLPGIRREVLDDDVVMLEYWLGEKRSFLWAVTRDSLVSRVLPARGEIETAARRFHEALSARGLKTPTGDVPAAVRRAGETLSGMILGPVAGELKGRRLLIVAEGALQYVPFAALPAPSQAARSGYQPLIVEHELAHAPSASVIGLLRRESAGRDAPPKAVAVFADPVFAVEDPRVSRPGAAVTVSVAAGPPRPAIEVQRSAAQSGLERFDRLPQSRREADAIASMAPAGRTLQALDFAAEKASVVGGDLSPYRIVHFATHGLLNSQHPELSGLVLSLVDRGGAARDGFLRLHEVYNLRLRADLVVLSACQTALGKAISGEGLVGLTRGFMYAGAPRVVASLWRVEDRATAELMTRFYRKLLSEGQRPASALREAQLSMWREPAWRAPQLWAGFLLQGEWR